MRCILAALAIAIAGCTSQAASPPPAVPSPSPRRASPGGDPFVVSPPIKDEELPLVKGPAVDAAKMILPPPAPGVEGEPAKCAEMAKRSPRASSQPREEPPGAAEKAARALADALSIEDESARDEALAKIDALHPLGFSFEDIHVTPGVIAALRAELAPECAEAIATPVLDAPPVKLEGSVFYALTGLVLASRFERIGAHPPKLDPPFDKGRVVAFTRDQLFPWFEAQARAVQSEAKLASSLVGYGKAIAAIEAGVADMRLVDAVRSAPIPDEMQKDEDAKNVYFGNLDQALDPRKDRGRDAALVGLREMTMVGAIDDARVAKARALLGKLYGGKRIDAWDALLLPPLPPVSSSSSVAARLAAKLPTFYAGLVIDPQDASRDDVMAALARRGVPIPMRAWLRSDGAKRPLPKLYARARLELGKIAWRAVDFDQAAAIASASRGADDDDTTLVLGVALALRGGPDDAAEIVRKAPVPSLHAIGDVAALDAIAAQRGRWAGYAAFDAAYVKEIAAPLSTPAATEAALADAAKRYRSAAELLEDPALKAKAIDRAKALEAIVASMPRSP